MHYLTPGHFSFLSNALLLTAYTIDLNFPKYNPYFSLFEPTKTNSRSAKLKILNNKVQEIAQTMQFPNPKSNLYVRMEESQSLCVAHGTCKQGVIGFSPTLVDEITENSYLVNDTNLVDKFTNFIKGSSGKLNQRLNEFKSSFSLNEQNQIKKNLLQFSQHLSSEELNFVIAHEISHLLTNDEVSKRAITAVSSIVSGGAAEYLKNKNPQNIAVGFVLHAAFFVMALFAVKLVHHIAFEKRADAKASEHFWEGGEMVFKRMELLKALQSQNSLGYADRLYSCYLTIKENWLYPSFSERLTNCQLKG